MKFKYFHAIKGGFVAFIVFVIAAFFISSNGPSREVEIILTISTFLFAIFASFFISRSNSRYDQIVELVAEEDAHWLSFYKTAVFFGKDFVDKIRELINNYYVVAYDFDAGDYYKYNAKYLHAIYDELDEVEISNNTKAQNTLSFMAELLAGIERNRNRSAVLTIERITKGQWAVMCLLAAIILFSVFYLKTPELYSQIIAVILSTTIVLILLIIRDLQNLRLSGSSVLEESGQEIFDYIGKMRYYHKKFIDNGSMKIPKYVKEYRMGTHNPGEDFNIQIIKR